MDTPERHKVVLRRVAQHNSYPDHTRYDLFDMVALLGVLFGCSYLLGIWNHFYEVAIRSTILSDADTETWLADLDPGVSALAILFTLLLILGFWDLVYDGMGAAYRLLFLRFLPHAAKWLAERPLRNILKTVALTLFGWTAYVCLVPIVGQFWWGFSDGLYMTKNEFATYCWGWPKKNAWYLQHLGQSYWMAELYCFSLDLGTHFGEVFDQLMIQLGMPEGEINQPLIVLLASIFVLFFFQSAWIYYAINRNRFLGPVETSEPAPSTAENAPPASPADKSQPATLTAENLSQPSPAEKNCPATPNAKSAPQTSPAAFERERELKLQMQALIDRHDRECKKYKREIKDQEKRLAAEVNGHNETKRQVEESKALVEEPSSPRLPDVQVRYRNPAYSPFLDSEVGRKNKELKHLRDTVKAWEATARELEDKVEAAEVKARDWELRARYWENATKDLKPKASGAKVPLLKKVTKQRREKKQAKEYLALSKKYNALQRQLKDETRVKDPRTASEDCTKLECQLHEERRQANKREAAYAKLNQSLLQGAQKLEGDLSEERKQAQERERAQSERQRTLSGEVKQLKRELAMEKKRSDARVQQSVSDNATQFTNQLNAERAEAQSLRATIADRDRKLAIVDGDMVALRARNEELANAANEIAQNVRHLADQNRELDAIKTSLDAELGELRSKATKLEEELNGVYIEKEFIEAQLDATTNEHSEGSVVITQERDAALEQVALLTQHTKDLEHQLTTEEMRYLGALALAEGAAQTAKAERDAFKEDLERRLDQALADLSSAKGQAEENARMAQENVRLAQESAKLAEKLAEKKKYYKGAYEAEVSSKNIKADRVRTLESELHHLRRRLLGPEGEQGSSQEIPKRRTGDIGSISSALEASQLRVVELERQNQALHLRLSGPTAPAPTAFAVNDPARQSVEHYQATLARERKEREHERVMWHRQAKELEEENQKLRIMQSNAQALGVSSSPFRQSGGRRS